MSSSLSLVCLFPSSSIPLSLFLVVSRFLRARISSSFSTCIDLVFHFHFPHSTYCSHHWHTNIDLKMRECVCVEHTAAGIRVCGTRSRVVEIFTWRKERERISLGGGHCGWCHCHRSHTTTPWRQGSHTYTLASVFDLFISSPKQTHAHAGNANEELFQCYPLVCIFQFRSLVLSSFSFFSFFLFRYNTTKGKKVCSRSNLQERRRTTTTGTMKVTRWWWWYWWWWCWRPKLW